MTKTIFSIIFLTAILMTATIAATVSWIEPAEALKSAGSEAPGRVPPSSFGSANKFIVCGDKLCSEYPGGYEQFKRDQGESSRIGTKTVVPTAPTPAPTPAPAPTLVPTPAPEPETTMEELVEEVAPGSVLRLSRANVPAMIPMHQGYYNGEPVYFIITDSSEERHAEIITENQGWKVELAPLLSFAPVDALSTTYVFTNGVDGDGVHGYQGEVFTSTPAQEDYSALASHVHVTWNDDSNAEVLDSEEAVLLAETDGRVSLTELKVVLNISQIVWPEGQMLVKEDKTLTDETPYGGGQILDIDTDEMIVTFIAHRGWGPDGRTIYYIVTDATPSGPAGMMGVTPVSATANLIANAAAVDLFQFRNGLTGSGPLGFQAGIAASGPGDANYSPMWRIFMIGWEDPESALLLETIDDINALKEAGLINVNIARPMDSDHIVNCPFIDPFQ